MTHKIKADAHKLWFTVPYSEAKLQRRLEALDRVVIEKVDTGEIAGHYYRIRLIDNFATAVLRTEPTDDGMTIVQLEHQDRQGKANRFLTLLAVLGLVAAALGALMGQAGVAFFGVWLALMVLLFGFRRQGLSLSFATGFFRGEPSLDKHQALFDYLVVQLSTRMGV